MALKNHFAKPLYSQVLERCMRIAPFTGRWKGGSLAEELEGSLRRLGWRRSTSTNPLARPEEEIGGLEALARFKEQARSAGSCLDFQWKQMKRAEDCAITSLQRLLDAAAVNWEEYCRLRWLTEWRDQLFANGFRL